MTFSLAALRDDGVQPLGSRGVASATVVALPMTNMRRAFDASIAAAANRPNVK